MLGFTSCTKTGTDQSGCDASVAPATTGGKDAQDRLVTAIVNMSAAQPQVLFAGAWLLTAGMVHGGQGIVAFARGRDAGMRQYAIKCAPASRPVCPLRLQSSRLKFLRTCNTTSSLRRRPPPA